MSQRDKRKEEAKRESKQRERKNLEGREAYGGKSPKSEDRGSG